MNLFNSIQSLERALDVSSLRQRLITSNIANVETPGYKTKDVSFAEILKKEQIKNGDEFEFQGYRTNPKHIQIGSASTNTYQPKIIMENRTSLLNNENNVDIDYEMTKLAENNIWYNTLTQMANKEFSMLRYVISEGRR
ncbi:flagellar basal body rod protein FlgB [Tepidibacillus fermentans]|uniref:Flagellar basal body rod protein FlgB n=1 Tax=Tepidibacillus fermentans TaxID=1281767 RepID=A0A4R3KJP1_9BACI|nr:flagellar basal body rod protein FlgB [Tepidibacillus fermentans]TCS82932.1 flagellar basal-body rod protein FlgB [Tepidibacillus fermentans]